MNLISLMWATIHSFAGRQAPVGDFATIQLPADTCIQMARSGGRDQVLEHALRDGWEAFEAPLPRIFRDTIARTSAWSWMSAPTLASIV